MTKELKHYLALITFLSFGLALFLIFNYNRDIQIKITLVMATGYIIWGIIHHHIRKELHLRIVLEYFLVAAVSGIVVIFLLMRT